MEILNSKQIENVKWALNNIDYDHWRKHWNYGYTYLNQHEIANKAGSILYECNIHKLNIDFSFKVEEYLKECEQINQLLDFIYKNNLNINQVKDIFNKTTDYLQEKIDIEKEKYEQAIKNLENKVLKSIIEKKEG